MGLGALMLGLLVRLRREPLRTDPVSMGFAALAGLCFAADLFCWHRAILLVGAGIATVLANTQVIWVALAGVLFLGERPGWRLWAAVPLAVLGISALSGALSGRDLSAADSRGLLLGLLTGLCYAGFVLSLRRVGQAPRPLSPLAGMCIVSLVSAVALGATAGAGGEVLAIPGPQALGLLLGLAFVGQCLGWVLISSSLPKVPASRAGLLLLLQPTLAMVWGSFLVPVPERLDALQMAGAALTLGAVYLGGVSRK
jgi:drug/metabolite transporter (DMT)-like permease